MRSRHFVELCRTPVTNQGRERWKASDGDVKAFFFVRVPCATLTSMITRTHAHAHTHTHTLTTHTHSQHTHNTITHKRMALRCAMVKNGVTVITTSLINCSEITDVYTSQHAQNYTILCSIV